MVPLDVLKAATFGAVGIEPRDDGFIPRRLPQWTRRQYADAGIGWVSTAISCPSHEKHDDLHPGQDGYDLMASCFAELARNPDHPLGRTFSFVLAGTTVREGEGARRLPAPPGPDAAVPR